MSKTYRYLTPRGQSLVFALTANIQDQLALSTKVLSPRGLGVDIYQHKIARNTPYTLPQPVGCESACDAKVVDLSAGVSFSGPLSAKAELVAMVTDILSGINAGEFDHLFNGFASNATDTYTLGTEG